MKDKKMAIKGSPVRVLYDLVLLYNYLRKARWGNFRK